MNKPSSFIWMVFILLLIVPTPAGKFIIDLAGGILLIITIIPLLLGGVGWFAWKTIQWIICSYAIGPCPSSNVIEEYACTIDQIKFP